MVYFIAIVSIVWVGFFLLTNTRKRRKNNKHKDKPPFRTEKDLQEYGKPMEDEHQPLIDFDDAE